MSNVIFIHLLHFLLNTADTRYSIETQLIMDTSRYRQYDFSLRDNLPKIVSTTLDVPKHFVSCYKVDKDWRASRSKADEIVVRLLATDKEDQIRILDLINSPSFLTNMNSEINKIRTLAEGKVTLKSYEAGVKTIAGI